MLVVALGAVSAVSQRLMLETIAVGSDDTVNFNLQQSLTDHTNYYPYICMMHMLHSSFDYK